MAQYRHYYINTNAQENGDHEVHITECQYLPNILYRRYLGYFPNCRDAVEEAKKHYKQSKSCKFCSAECYTD